MTNQAQELLYLIGAMNTLVENFPESILSLFKGKKYTSVFAFIVDILNEFGVDLDEITSGIIEKMFGSRTKKSFDAVVKVIKNSTSQDYLYEQLGMSDFGANSEEFEKLEDSVKVIIIEILTGLMTCSAIPIIPNKYMDKYKNKKTYGHISIPVSLFDLYGKLNICPTTTTGTCFYNMDVDYTYKPTEESLALAYIDSKNALKAAKIKSGKATKDEISVYSEVPIDDEIKMDEKYIHLKNDNEDSYYVLSTKSSLNVNELYKSNDLDAFIWYCLNRGNTSPQIEYNKMIWDSRRKNNLYAKSGDLKRDTNEKWVSWLKSKEVQTDDIYLSSVTASQDTLFPIMQLEKETQVGGEKSIRVSICSQKYYKGAKSLFGQEFNPNHTIYLFNKDYMESVGIFNIKEIMAGLISLLYDIGIPVTEQQELINSKIDAYIDSIIEADDASADNTYFTFSNDDYDNFLYNGMLKKYNAKSNGYNVVQYDLSDGDLLNNVNTVDASASVAGTVSNTTRLVYNVTETEPTSETGDNGTSEFDLVAFLKKLIKPIARQIFSPKVLLLYEINMAVTGLITKEEFQYYMTHPDKLIDFILQKIGSLIKSIIIYIKDVIVEYLLELIRLYLIPLIMRWISKVLLEKINNWIKLIEKILSLLPTFDFKNYYQNMTINPVNYADIITDTSNTPILNNS